MLLPGLFEGRVEGWIAPRIVEKRVSHEEGIVEVTGVDHVRKRADAVRDVPVKAVCASDTVPDFGVDQPGRFPFAGGIKPDLVIATN